ncbi:hypothetical protein [Psychrobacter celer]|uniref:hypothetical protein n=1 Tax=Psychrobacter celer TaxID=306572 RepID=UPI002FE430A7
MIFNPYLLQPHLLSYFLSLNILLISLSISGCILNNPAHSPSITGDIEISKNSKGDLCFMPIFSSATVMDNPINFNYIKMEELVILDPNAEVSSHVKIQIKPANKDYFSLKNGQKVCLNSDNINLKQTIYSKLDKQLLVVSIGGLDDKEEHFISFQRKFDYPYTPE